jgi:hypothetical protein
MSLLLEVSVVLLARKMILFFWTTCILYSGDLMLLHLILQSVTGGKPLIMFMPLAMLRSKYDRQQVPLYVQVT